MKLEQFVESTSRPNNSAAITNSKEDENNSISSKHFDDVAVNCTDDIEDRNVAKYENCCQ